MDSMKPITSEMLRNFEECYSSRPDLSVLSDIMSNTELNQAAFIPANAARLRMDFSVTVPTTNITNQKQSGRCWMFCVLNLLRERVIKKCGLKDFALSASYLAFYDKLEKSNNFLESIMALAGQNIQDRETNHLMKRTLPDGGQWDMCVALIKKYGLLPSWVMPETTASSGTAAYDTILERKLREDAIELRKMIRSGQDAQNRKAEMLQEIYNALCILYGKPVKQFDFAYSDKDGIYHCDSNLTPLQFYKKYVGDDLDDYIPIITSPIHEYFQTYTQPYMNSAVEYDMFWLNLPIEDAKALAIKQLCDGEGVVFCCDTLTDLNRAEGYLDQESFRYGDVLGGMRFGMNKAERMLTCDSRMNHNMMLCGVNIKEDGQPDRWKIENSWGDTAGQKGYFVCSDSWFSEFVYQVVVRKKYLSVEQLKMLDKTPIPMKLWDPLA